MTYFYSVFNWGFGVIFLLAGLLSLPKTPVIALPLIVIASLLLPPVRSLVQAKTNKSIPFKVRLVVVLALVMVVGALAQEEDKKREQQLALQKAKDEEARIAQLQQQKRKQFEADRPRIVAAVRTAIENKDFNGAVYEAAKYLHMGDAELQDLHDLAKKEIAAKTEREKSEGKASLAILKVDDFEKSDLHTKYQRSGKNSWNLQSGGTNFSYSYPDLQDNTQTMSVELSSNPMFITRVGISFVGRSINSPAQLTPQRESFVRDVVKATYPDINQDELVELVKQKQGLNAPGGSDTVPAVEIKNASVKAFVNASSLHIVILR